MFFVCLYAEERNKTDRSPSAPFSTLLTFHLSAARLVASSLPSLISAVNHTDSCINGLWGWLWLCIRNGGGKQKRNSKVGAIHAPRAGRWWNLNNESLLTMLIWHKPLFSSAFRCQLSLRSFFISECEEYQILFTPPNALCQPLETSSERDLSLSILS